MSLKLEILIPTLPERHRTFNALHVELERQTKEAGYVWGVDVCGLSHHAAKGETTIGEKRNYLLRTSIGEYVAFFDDDDFPAPNYISSVMEGINKGVDCCSLRGIITWNGENPEVFEHSIKYSDWKTNHTGEIKYERYINHLNVVKREIAIQIKFPEINHGEDKSWSEALRDSGLIKTEHYIGEPIYNYLYHEKK
jgi:hypothetical protein